MPHVIGISGSLRKGSFNSALLRAAVEVAPPGCTIEIASIAGIPLYDGDVEAQGMPSEVIALKEKIAKSDGVLLVTPEYNGSLPGVAKNAIDWCSRPASDIPRVFGDRPVAVIGATPGMGGTRLSQNAWLPVFRVLGMRPYFGKSLYVAGAGKVFDADGALVDATVRKILTDVVAGFASFASPR
jgi:chromate reductase, NAD(P)H dehydrogenase (quinone)